MRPTQPRGKPASPRAVAKQRGAVQQRCPSQKCASVWRVGNKKAAGAGPAASGARRSSGRKLVRRGRFQSPASAGVVGATLPVMARAARPATHAEQHGEAVLLALIEALVERLRSIGELLQACG